MASAHGTWASPTQVPQRLGFTDSFGFLGGAHSYFSEHGILRGNEEVQELDYTTDGFGREAVACIERNKGKPWLLYLAMNAVHTPMDATTERVAKFENIRDPQHRTYAAMMSAMDDIIGRAIQALKDTGQYENTLVSFISDNSSPNMNGVTVNDSVNTPLRDSEQTTLQGSIRMPFLLSRPTRSKPDALEIAGKLILRPRGWKRSEQGDASGSAGGLKSRVV